MTKTEDQKGFVSSGVRYYKNPNSFSSKKVLDIVNEVLGPKSKKIKKPKKKPDYKKVNRTRRSRGYNFEYNLVNAFNNHVSGEWYARRLGGSSTGFPDVVVTNNTKSILYSIECKSGQGNTLYIPIDQIERCFEITNKFLSNYLNKHVSFAFKFKGNNKRKLQYRIIQDVVITPILLKSIKSVSYNIIDDVLTFHFKESEYQFEHKDEFYHKDCKFLESIEDYVNWNGVVKNE